MAHRTMQDTPNTQGVTIAETAEVLEIIREEQVSMYGSMDTLRDQQCNNDLICKCDSEPPEETIKVIGISPEEVKLLLQENEAKLREHFEKKLVQDMSILKDRFDFILSNEQIRASFMLREAHRERQEKVTALQAQLECKNLAGLMYVMCAERRRSKLERLRLIEEYTTYIHALQDILTEAQDLILHLSRGYKTAARVDHEWRTKMIKIVTEFMSFVYHYAGGTPESNQYFFDLPALLQTRAPTADNPNENPCEKSEDESSEPAEPYREKTWWECLEGTNRPFVMFGDMADFKPDRRRETLKSVKAAKTAPKKWKEYVFHDMFVRSDCSNADSIKDVYPTKLPTSERWACHEAPPELEPSSRTSIMNHRATAHSVDIRGNMGSILKIITSNVIQQAPKTTILAARDSMEIQSATRLREKGHARHSTAETGNVVLNIGGRRKTSIFEEPYEEDENPIKVPKSSIDDTIVSDTGLGSLHNDSLQVIQTHTPDQDHRINYEKVCPMDKCQRMQMDSFTRSLPPYMRASPYTHFEQTFEGYETCTPEQLELLKHRIEAKQARLSKSAIAEGPLLEWTPSIQGVATQTSTSFDDLPPCTCRVPSLAELNGMIFNVADLLPIKQALESINKACFFDGTIEFNRFKVVGEDVKDANRKPNPNQDFTRTRYQEIAKILKKHPSLLDIFQANTRC